MTLEPSMSDPRPVLAYLAGDPAQCLDEFDSVEEAVQSIREYWCEDDGPLLIYLLASEGSRPLAVLLRPTPGDPAVCLTLYADGRLEHHLCRYLLDAEGRYQSTEITDLDAEEERTHYENLKCGR